MDHAHICHKSTLGAFHGHSYDTLSHFYFLHNDDHVGWTEKLHVKMSENYFKILEVGKNVRKWFGQSTKMSENGPKKCKIIQFTLQELHSPAAMAQWWCL